MSVFCSIAKMKKMELSFYFLCLLVTASFVYHRGQDVNGDLLNYHFYQGYSLINGRFMEDIAAAGAHSFLNPIADILIYLSLTHLPFPVSAWVFLLIQLASIPAIVLLAKEVAGGLGYQRAFVPAIPAIVLSLLAPLWWSELGTSYIESWTAPLIIYGVYFLFSARKGSDLSMARIAIAGVLFGLAVGLKWTNGPFGVSGFLMLAALLYRSEFRVSLLAVFYFLAGCGVGFLLTAWWNWYLWSEWGNPVFPYYNAIFKSEFFDFVNWKNEKYHFSSFQEFLTFIVQAAWGGTKKTSLVLFADARFLFATMLVPAAILCKPAMRLNRQLMAFLLFMASCILLWVFMEPIQRYFVPFELLLGLLIWILIVRIVKRDWLCKALMIGLILCAGLLIKVPDWKHMPMAMGEENPFQIEMDEQLYATPARYIVTGHSISYLLPSFHPDSKFYGVWASIIPMTRVHDRVFRKLAEPSDLPLRILAPDGDVTKIPYVFQLENILKLAGYGSLDRSLLDCKRFKARRTARYIVCELPSEESILERMDPVSPGEKLDFGSSGKGVQYLRVGWAAPDSWGTLSASRFATISLPTSPEQVHSIIIDFNAVVSPSHSVQRVEIFVNGSQAFSGSIRESGRLEFKIPEAAKSDSFKGITMEFRLPDAASPKEMGTGEDTRTLALGLRAITLTEDFLEKMEPVSPGEKLGFGSSAKGVHYLQEGWSDPEDWGTWSASRSATIFLKASPAQVDSVVIDFAAAVSPSHPVQRVEILVNGSQAFSGSISERSGTIEFKIPEVAKSDSFKGITMEFRLPDAARPKEMGTGEDMRTLAIGLQAITLKQQSTEDGANVADPRGGKSVEEILEPDPVSHVEMLDFGSSGKGVRYLRVGWSAPEDWGTRSVARYATISLPTSPTQVHSIVIDFANAFVTPSHPVQRVEIDVNGSQAFFGSISERSGTIEFKIPEAAKSDSFKGIKMEFRLPDAASPKEMGIGSDVRTLAIGLRSITLKLLAPRFGGKSVEEILELDPVSPGEKLDFGSSRKGVGYLRAGWSAPEDWGTWSASRYATIFLPTSPEQVDSVVMDFAASVSPSHPVQRVEILVNGSQAFSGSIISGSVSERFGTLEFKIPEAAKSDSFKGITMEFRLPDAASPKEMGTGEDTRTLALGLQAITLKQQSTEDGANVADPRGGKSVEEILELEPVSPGEKLGFGSSAKGVHYLQVGWSAPEDWGTWSDSRSATILLPTSPAQVDSVAIDFAAAVSPSHPVQRVEIFVNGFQAFSGSIKESGTLEFKIPDAAKSDAFKGIKMEFRLPDAASPKEMGTGEDTRTLALGLQAITLTGR